MKYVNYILCLIHLSQGIAYVVLSLLYDAQFPFTITVPLGRPGKNETIYETRILTHANPLVVISAMMFVTSFFHLIRGCLQRHDDYALLNNKDRETDRFFRWTEYSISSTLMIVVIFMESGISDLYAVVCGAAANFAMICFGFAGDLTDPLGRPKFQRITFLCGTITAMGPWSCIFSQLVFLGNQVPLLVYGIVVSLFLLFFGFAVNELTYIATFPGTITKNKREETFLELRDSAEFRYQILSVVSKTLLGALLAADIVTLN